MKTIILSFFACLLTAQSSFAAHPSGLKEIIDNYKYSVEVEWDQKDQNVLNQFDKKFNDDLQTLIAQGQSPRDLLNQALSTIPNDQFKSEVVEGLTLASQEEMSPEQLNEMMMVIASKNSVQGAAWSAWATVGVSVVAAVVIARIAVQIYFYEWGKKL